MPFTKTSTHKEAYGVKFNLGLEDYEIELSLYARHDELLEKGRVPGLLKKWEHFVNAAKILYGPDCKSHFVWHPWALKMIKASCANQYVGLAGSSSCGKSEFMGLWLVLNWLADYQHTMCIATSEGIRESLGRIWASVKRYYMSLPTGIDGVIGHYVELPTPRISSIWDKRRQGNAGIMLQPADSSQNNTKDSKMTGFKANKGKGKGKMYLAGDEFNKLSHALVSTLMNNLSSNDIFHAIAAANPQNKFDPFGAFVKPKNGWGSIHVEMEQWELSNGGICLHFDALKNPNYLAKKNLWPIQKYEAVEQAIKEAGGENTPNFWRFCRAFWLPAGADGSSGVYSDLEITQKNNDRPIELDDNHPKSRWAGVDTAFKEGGDRCIYMCAEKGVAKETGREAINLLHYKEIVVDTNNTEISRDRQIAKKIVQFCEEDDVPPENMGIDETGAGGSFCTILAEEWENNSFYRCNFGGKPTERPVSDLDETPSNQKYAYRDTEMWFYGKELIRHGQLWNIAWIPLQTEMTERRHTTKKNTNGFPVVQMESKKELRKRTSLSPDIADALFILLDTTRERKGIKGVMTQINNDKRGPENFLKFVKSRNVVLKANRRLVW